MGSRRDEAYPAGFSPNPRTKGESHRVRWARRETLKQVLSSLTGVTTRLSLTLYGNRDDRVLSLAADLGYRTNNWTVDTLDWQTTATPESITTIVMDHLANSVIVLMHAGSQVESQTLDGLMTKIEQAGYKIVTLQPHLLTQQESLEGERTSPLLPAFHLCGGLAPVCTRTARLFTSCTGMRGVLVVRRPVMLSAHQS
jgi:hypothetical protein